MRFVKRTGKSTDKFTHGHIYRLIPVERSGVECFTVDNDKGEYSRICFGDDAGPDFNPADYWIECTAKGIELDYQQTEKRAFKMAISKTITVKTSTFINDREADTYSDERIVEMIQHEEEKIENLKKLKVASKAIANLEKKHTDTITALVKVLEERQAD